MRSIWLFLLVPVLSSCAVSLDGWEGDANFKTLQSSEPSGEETLIDARVELNIGELSVQAAQDNKLYELDLFYDENSFEPRVDLRREGDVAHFDFELSGEGKLSRKIGKTALNLGFSADTPLRLGVRTGVSESEINLSGMSIRELEIEAGVGETHLIMVTPNQGNCDRVDIRSGVGEFTAKGLGNLGFSRFKFQGGLGGTVLDFAGDWAVAGDVVIQVGVGGLRVLLPREIGVELRTSKSFLSGVSMSGFDRKGDVYYSQNYDEAGTQIKVEVNAGIGGVEIEWI